MSEQSILQRYITRDDNAPGADAEGTDDLGGFGWLRGIQARAVMLELRKKDGNILAIGYGYLDHVEFDPSEGIRLSVAGRKIRIKGRNLNEAVRPTIRLFEGITRHRVPWVRESDRAETMEAGKDATVIDSIAWE